MFTSELCKTNTHFSLLARPVFDPRYATKHMGIDSDPTKLMEDYSRNCKLFTRPKGVFILTMQLSASYLINLSQAVGRLILTGRDLTRFAGYTVCEFADNVKQ